MTKQMTGLKDFLVWLKLHEHRIQTDPNSGAILVFALWEKAFEERVMALYAKQAEFFEWLESIPDIQDYLEEGVISGNIYRKKKRELLGDVVKTD